MFTNSNVFVLTLHYKIAEEVKRKILLMVGFLLKTGLILK